MGRHNYVTPTSYLELIASFKKLLNEKRDTVEKARKRYAGGLDKLKFAASQVGGFRYNITRLYLASTHFFELMKTRSKKFTMHNSHGYGIGDNNCSYNSAVSLTYDHLGV